MRGKILQIILETLEEGARNQLDFFEAVLSSGYGASMNKIEYECLKNKNKRLDKNINLKDLKEKRIRLQKFLSKLKKDGLIKETKGEKIEFSISINGKARLDELRKNLPTRYYKKEVHSNSLIISFDIPEKLRGKRDWLREVIRNLGFKIIHQSVWIGSIKIPEQLIIDLEEMNVLQYVEIFEITKTGSLKKIN